MAASSKVGIDDNGHESDHGSNKQTLPQGTPIGNSSYAWAVQGEQQLQAPRSQQGPSPAAFNDGGSHPPLSSRSVSQGSNSIDNSGSSYTSVSIQPSLEDIAEAFLSTSLNSNLTLAQGYLDLEASDRATLSAMLRSRVDPIHPASGYTEDAPLSANGTPFQLPSEEKSPSTGDTNRPIERKASEMTPCPKVRSASLMLRLMNFELWKKRHGCHGPCTVQGSYGSELRV